jgi:hypothetical protein
MINILNTLSDVEAKELMIENCVDLRLFLACKKLLCENKFYRKTLKAI